MMCSLLSVSGVLDEESYFSTVPATTVMVWLCTSDNGDAMFKSSVSLQLKCDSHSQTADCSTANDIMQNVTEPCLQGSWSTGNRHWGNIINQNKGMRKYHYSFAQR